MACNTTTYWVKIKQKENKNHTHQNWEKRKREGVGFVGKGPLLLFKEAGSFIVRVATPSAWKLTNDRRGQRARGQILSPGPR